MTPSVALLYRQKKGAKKVQRGFKKFHQPILVSKVNN